METCLCKCLDIRDLAEVQGELLVKVKEVGEAIDEIEPFFTGRQLFSAGPANLNLNVMDTQRTTHTHTFMMWLSRRNPSSFSRDSSLSGSRVSSPSHSSKSGRTSGSVSSPSSCSTVFLEKPKEGTLPEGTHNTIAEIEIT